MLFFLRYVPIFFGKISSFLKKAIKIPLWAIAIAAIAFFFMNRKISSMKGIINEINFNYAICRENTNNLQEQINKQNKLISDLKQRNDRLKQKTQELIQELQKKNEVPFRIASDNYSEIKISIPEIEQMSIEEKKACIKARKIALKELGLEQ